MGRITRFCLVFAWLSAAAGCRPRPSIERVEWPVMGTVAALQFEGGIDKKAVAAVKEIFGRIENLLNAHDPESELRRLAPLEDAEVMARADPYVRKCYEEAFAMRDATEGAFDPRWRGKGTLDLGAIAKGFAVDLAAAAVATSTAARALVDLGGNLKAVNGLWRVAVAGSAETFDLPQGSAVATSAKYFRGDHIADARTGRPAAPRYKSVSVIHPSSASTADALSTVLFILGRERAEAFLRGRHPEARAVFSNF